MDFWVFLPAKMTLEMISEALEMSGVTTKLM
jgi:hypothetical protein